MGTQITLKRLTGAIGAEVRGVNLNHPLDESTFATIHQAFLNHCMLVFRGQFLEPEAQTVFAHRWGEVLRAPYVKQREMPAHPEVLAQVNQGKAYAFTTEQWYSDLSFMPPSGPCHSGGAGITGGGRRHHVCQPVFGLRNVIRGHEAPPPAATGMARRAKLACLVGIEDSAPPQSHPVVRTHPETGRKGLYINRLYTYCLEGLTEAESRGLLAFLFEQICRPEFTYRHQWASGDVVMWDNRCTVHYIVHDYGEAPRVMHRTIIAGDAPR
jgi:taurine dioxygenase